MLAYILVAIARKCLINPSVPDITQPHNRRIVATLYLVSDWEHQVVHTVSSHLWRKIAKILLNFTVSHYAQRANSKEFTKKISF